MPEATSEPNILTHIVQHALYDQRKIHAPKCSRHGVPMIMLGHHGFRSVKAKKKNTMETIHKGQSGLLVALGMFRCPYPGCYLVAPLE